MKTLRLFRNLAALFILGAAVLVTRPSVGSSKEPAGYWFCWSDGSTTNGYNCTFNSDGTCSQTKCKSGQPCNNYKCSDDSSVCGYEGNKKCQFFF
jgi:hypothetical protein